ncbi:MAG: glycine cleavage system aminomethyltransferase GcvT [Bdellovibrionota bacterium]
MHTQVFVHEPRKTPLYDNHQKLGAKFTEFGGWMMPVRYSGLVDEHVAVREAAGLFDVSHMGEITVTGPKAFAFLQFMCSNDLKKIRPGEAQYSALLNPRGGVIDDIIIYMLSAESYLLCVNAGNTEKDWNWIQQSNTFGVTLKNVSSAYGQIALQGPRAREILSQLLGIDSQTISRNDFRPFTFRVLKHQLGEGAPTELIVACTGYTGEDGFEIFCPAERTSALWDSLLEVGQPLGLKPAGLGARDTLRLEACYPLHGHELRDDISALSSGLGWIVQFDKGDFIGRDALLKDQSEGLPYRLVGLEVLSPGIIREGTKLFTAGGEEIGWVASGTKPPTVNAAIGMGFVPPEHAALGTKLTAEVRGKHLDVKIIRRPFYKQQRVTIGRS